MPGNLAKIKLKELIAEYKQDNRIMEERIAELDEVVKHNLNRLESIKADLDTSENLIDLLRETVKYGTRK